jgi:hypothetical protein
VDEAYEASRKAVIEAKREWAEARAKLEEQLKAAEEKLEVRE